MKTCVLVVESDSRQQKSMVEILKAFDYSAVGTPTVAHALSALRGVVFDAVVIAVKPAHVEEIFEAAEAKKIQPSLKLIAVSTEPPPVTLPIELDEYIHDPFLLIAVGDALSRLFPATRGLRQ